MFILTFIRGQILKKGVTILKKKLKLRSRKQNVVDNYNESEMNSE